MLGLLITALGFRDTSASRSILPYDSPLACRSIGVLWHCMVYYVTIGYRSPPRSPFLLRMKHGIVKRGRLDQKRVHARENLPVEAAKKITYRKRMLVQSYVYTVPLVSVSLLRVESPRCIGGRRKMWSIIDDGTDVRVVVHTRSAPYHPSIPFNIYPAPPSFSYRS